MPKTEEQCKKMRDDMRDKILRMSSLYFAKNGFGDTKIGDLAKHFYISESYICRIFKSATGTTINKYMTARRISIAKSLLAEGVGVSEVCERCGFSDYSNFLKAFTKSVGISPKKYSQYCNR